MSEGGIEAEYSRSDIPSLVPTNLVVFLPYVAQQLNMPFVIVVQKRQQAEYVSKVSTARRMTRRIPLNASRSEHKQSEEKIVQRPAAIDAGPEFTVNAVFDATGRIVEVCLERCAPPCLLIKVLQLALPHLRALERMSVRHCRLTPHTLDELSNLTLRCSFTDLCLDDSPVPGGNYERLLDDDRLRRLSLARCSLDDEAVVRLATRLCLGAPAARSLRSLVLTANRIGDVGARALATALRTNRALLHLDLAGNEIGDEGGRALLGVLHDFPLTDEEMAGRRRRRMAYVRRVAEVKAQCLARLQESATRGGGEETRRRRTTVRAERLPAEQVAERSLEGRAATMAVELVGPDGDPYCAAETVQRPGRPHCRGNFALVYLNVAYNSMSAVSLALLERVLAAQAERGLAAQAERGLVAQVVLRRPGLLRVVLDGNALPVHVPQYAACEMLLDQTLAARTGKTKQSKSKS